MATADRLVKPIPAADHLAFGTHKQSFYTAGQRDVVGGVVVDDDVDVGVELVVVGVDGVVEVGVCVVVTGGGCCDGVVLVAVRLAAVVELKSDVVVWIGELSVVVGVSVVDVTDAGAEVDATGCGGSVVLGPALRGLNTHTPNAISPTSTTPPMMAGFFHAPGFFSSSRGGES
jgi:hypothetical protein